MGIKKTGIAGFNNFTCEQLTLASFETGIRFANHKDFTAATNDFTVTMAGLGRFQGIQDFHGIFQNKQVTRSEIIL
jgi:hypothetical protein